MWNFKYISGDIYVHLRSKKKKEDRIAVLPDFITCLEKELRFVNENIDDWISTVELCDYRWNRMVKTTQENGFDFPKKKSDENILFWNILKKAGSADIQLLLFIELRDWKKDCISRDARGCIKISKSNFTVFLK